jgi:hypothetical protein
MLLVQLYAIFGTYIEGRNISFKDTGVGSKNFNIMPDAAYGIDLNSLLLLMFFLKNP